MGRGVIKAETKENYISIVKDLVGRGAEGIILGCTEIPMLIGQADFSIPIFDTTKIHSQAVVEYVLQKIETDEKEQKAAVYMSICNSSTGH